MSFYNLSPFDIANRETIKAKNKSQHVLIENREIEPGFSRDLLLKLDCWIKSISYKKNFTFEYGLADRFSIFIRIIVRAVDSVSEQIIIEIFHQQRLELSLLSCFKFKDFERYIYDRIREVELHEMNEFFKVDGKVIYDPHAKDVG